MTARFAAGVSEHPLVTHAVGELVGQVLDELQAEPDVAVLFVTGQSVGAVEDIAGSVRQLLRPAVLVGASAVSVVGGPREVEDRAAVGLWAGRTGPVTPFRLTTRIEGGAAVTEGAERLRGDGPRTAMVLADPFTFAADALVAQCGGPDGTTFVGGLASAGNGPGGNRLVLDDEVFLDGAVGFVLPQGLEHSAVVSQGCRPVGQPFVVTKADRNVILELGGRPATERLAGLVQSATEDERSLLAGGLHLGKVIDERRAEYRRGDFLIRGVLGADRSSGGVLVNDVVEVGSTVQFQVRDAATATEDLERVLAGRSAESALLFTCNGRGQRLFGEPDHDASRVHTFTGSRATAGMFCAGEVGPVGDRSFLHTYTASVLLLGEGAAGA